ncbi:MAG: LemA family protein [Actinobacteria bacterium]|nr:LemA family protein [Actinomycetota bacterium]
MTALIIIVVVVLLLLVWVVAGYNGLVTQRNRVQNAWSTIDVQLKRRYDLIPNLLETVRGYAEHERDVLTAVTAARTSAMEADTVREQAHAENELSHALFNLRAVAEDYPELRASEQFGQLADELTNTEDRIAFARQAYNDTVNRYDTKRQRIPTNVIANIGGFEAYEYFEADTDSRSPVQVKF